MCEAASRLRTYAARRAYGASAIRLAFFCTPIAQAQYGVRVRYAACRLRQQPRIRAPFRVG